MMSTVVRTSLAVLAASVFPSRAAAWPKVFTGEAEHIGNVCRDRSDGWQCHEDHAVHCLGGRTISHQSCAAYQECKEGPGTASCIEDACKHKEDGLHCHDGDVVRCLDKKTTNVTECPFYEECKRDKLQANVAACQEAVCDDKADGTYCENNHIVECADFATVKLTKCGFSEQCEEDALGIDQAACAEDFCNGRANGQYCERDGVVTCTGERMQTFFGCYFYQECAETLQSGVRQVNCEDDACHDKTDGWHCKDHHIVRCSGLETIEVELCPSFKECQEKADMSAECV